MILHDQIFNQICCEYENIIGIVEDDVSPFVYCIDENGLVVAEINANYLPNGTMVGYSMFLYENKLWSESSLPKRKK